MQAPQVHRRNGFAAIVFGVLLLVVGAYYVLRNTLGFALPELDSEAVWPVLVLGLGLVLVYRGWLTR